MNDTCCNSPLAAGAGESAAAQNAADYRAKLRLALTDSLHEYLRLETEELLVKVAEAAFYEGWIAAGGAPPHVIHSGGGLASGGGGRPETQVGRHLRDGALPCPRPPGCRSGPSYPCGTILDSLRGDAAYGGDSSGRCGDHLPFQGRHGPSAAYGGWPWGAASQLCRRTPLRRGGRLRTEEFRRAPQWRIF